MISDKGTKRSMVGLHFKNCLDLGVLGVSKHFLNSKLALDSQRSIQEEEEDNGPPEYREPLGAALDQLDDKKSVDKPNVGFINPIFDTTDL